MRIALQTGAKLVPVIGFGEPELYTARRTAPGSMRAMMQKMLKTMLGFTLPEAVGVGLFTSKWTDLGADGVACCRCYQ